VTVDVVGADQGICHACAVAGHEDVAVVVEDEVVDASAEELRKGLFALRQQVEGLWLLFVVAKAYSMTGGHPQAVGVGTFGDGVDVVVGQFAAVDGV
jgi:hypothetical protein